jgi:putative SOS response-associated peptidase YedK
VVRCRTASGGHSGPQGARSSSKPYMWGMCGRFTYKLTWEELVRLYRLTLDQPARNTQARYNVCPTDPIDTIVESNGQRELVSMRWGLVPRWWSKSLKDVKVATFNARAETVETKPFFRDAFKRMRCLIRMAGYARGEATLVFYGQRRFACANCCWPMG